MSADNPSSSLAGKVPARPPKTKVFGVWGLAIFTFSFLVNVNTTPQLATFGLASIVIFLLAIGLFLTPTAMAATEMGTTWPRTGGIYIWTRMAFGEPAGFMIIWLEWANFVVAWPGIMGTLTLEAAFIVDPELNNNPLFLVSTVILVTWIAAGMALRGLKVARGFAWYSVVIGTVIPVVVLVGFAIASLVGGTPPAMDASPSAIFSGFDATNIAFISGALLMFSGIEISAIHAADIQNPARTIPRSNLIAVALCFILLVPLTMSIAILVPSKEIDIVTGLLQSAQTIFDRFDVGWLLPIFGFCVVTGLATALVQIINGPSRGLVVAGRQGGSLPPALPRENSNKMPVVIILLQATISSILSLGYFFLGSVQNAWFMFALIQTNMTLIMYLIMFASVIKLRYSRPNVNRPYQIPGKKVGLWAITGIGMLICIVGVLVSFQPTDEAAGMSTAVYITILLLGTVAFVAMPFVFWIFRKPSWKTEEAPDPDQPDPEALDAAAAT